MAHQLDVFDGTDGTEQHQRIRAYRHVRDSLLRALPDQAPVARSLALAGIRHLDGDGRRIVVRGRDGSVARALVKNLSSALSLSSHEIDAPGLAQTNWHGSDLAVHLEQLLHRVVAAHGPQASTEAAAHTCILVRRLDGIRLVGAYASASTRDHAAGQQLSLVPLIEGAAISLDRSGSTFDSGQSLVVVAAELGDLPKGTPDVGDLASWGLLPELAEVLGHAMWVHVPPPTAALMEGEIRRGIRQFEAMFEDWGYRVIVTDQVLRHVLRAVGAGPLTGGSRAALRWIESGCEAGLIRMIEDGAAPGTTWVLAVDDLNLPSRPRGVWRE